MKRIWNSFLIAFAMFSKIPVPRADWDLSLIHISEPTRPY